jgi:hypothetical protein
LLLVVLALLLVALLCHGCSVVQWLLQWLLLLLHWLQL